MRIGLTVIVSMAVYCAISSVTICHACPAIQQGQVVYSESFANQHKYPPAWCFQQNATQMPRPIPPPGPQLSDLPLQDQLRIIDEISSDPKLANDPEAMAKKLGDLLERATGGGQTQPSGDSSSGSSTDQTPGVDSSGDMTTDGGDEIYIGQDSEDARWAESMPTGDDELIGNSGGDDLISDLEKVNDYLSQAENFGVDPRAFLPFVDKEDRPLVEAAINARDAGKSVAQAIEGFSGFFGGGDGSTQQTDAQPKQPEAGAPNQTSSIDEDDDYRTLDERLKDAGIDLEEYHYKHRDTSTKRWDIWQNHAESVFGTSDPDKLRKENAVARDYMRQVSSSGSISLSRLEYEISAAEMIGLDSPTFSGTSLEGLPAGTSQGELSLVEISQQVEKKRTTLRAVAERERYELSQRRDRLTELNNALVGSWDDMTEADQQELRANIAQLDENVKRREFRVRLLNEEIKAYGVQAQRIRDLTPVKPFTR